MTELDLECRIFTRYLIGRDPDGYIVKKYVDLQRAIEQDDAGRSRIDSLLLRFSRRGTAATHLADAYARIFRPHSLLRRKLILVTAILENSAAFHRDFTSGGSNSLAAGLLGITIALLRFGISLAAGMLIFLPCQIFFRTTRPDETR